MIDNQTEVDELLREIEANLPIPVRATSRLERHLLQQGTRLPRALAIKSAFYAGDEGGIMCDITSSPEAKSATVVSLTHLWISASHPLGDKIRAYQQKRKRRLAFGN